ncbi:MAG: glucosamine-6-phosphate deaminase [Clostridia bacterium]|nr:glucosamine-6-phosphate deaminase [Clostridia bacterium]
MKFIVCENYEEMSKKAAEIMADVIKNKPDCVLGLATGSTPTGTYQELIKMNKSGEISFNNVVSYNLDEYYPISPDNDQSYRYFMNDNLFNHIDIKMENTHVLNGEAEDADAECRAYDEAIKNAGGIDIQILGIGRNGHIAFNEPAEALIAPTHKTGLTEDTIDANSRFFESADLVPRHSLTMGMASIFGAKKIILLANGASKKEAIKDLLSDEIKTSNPATLLKLHHDVTILCDKEAYGE